MNSLAQLEASLQNLTSGPHQLYLVSPEEWKKASAAVTPNQPETFSPYRHIAKLTVP